MKEFSSCKLAMQSCMESKSFAVAHLYNDDKPMEMHIHDCYEIYYSISGGKQFLIDNCFYDIQEGDIFLINQFESHYLSQIDSQKHERIVMSINPEYLKELSTNATDLSRCFSFRDTDMPHRMHLSTEEQNRFLNRAFNARCKNAEESQAASTHNAQVDAILSYINAHMQDALSLNELSSHFYLSSSYICRIFKAATGTTINKYITAKRITLSKSLLSQGYSVNEACEACGFNDYSNYLKAFTKAVGISPKKYAQYNS